MKRKISFTPLTFFILQHFKIYSKSYILAAHRIFFYLSLQCYQLINATAMLANVLFTIFAWIFVGAIIICSVYWIVVLIQYICHSVKGTPSTGNGAGDVIYRYMGYDKTYHVRIDITTEETENTKE